MVITCFDYKGMVYTHTVPTSTTVNGEYYKTVLQHLIKDHIPKKRPELARSWKLHHDNARPHVAGIVTEFLNRKGIQCVPHPPYSPDVAPCDFFVYSTAKKELKGRRFQTSAAAAHAFEAILKLLSKNGFEHLFREWQRRWGKVIALHGDHIEHDRGVKITC